MQFISTSETKDGILFIKFFHFRVRMYGVQVTVSGKLFVKVNNDL